MKIKTSLALLFFFLAACVPTVAPAPTGTPVPSVVPPTFTPTANTIYPTPSLYPTQHPPPILTPDAIQVERWKEYQTELAKALFVYNPAFPQWDYGPAVSKDAICEWDILERSGQEVYLWAACISADGLSLRTNPAVIYLEPDGSIREVSVPSVDVNFHDQTVTYDLHLLPMDVREKLCLYYFYGFVPQCHEITSAYIPSFDLRREGVFLSHLEYRKNHPEEPPLIVLSATPTATGRTPVGITPSPMPTQPIIPVITPDAIQVERWKEYQTELAKLVLSEAGAIFPDYESALCEWDILGRSGQELYVWARCFAPNAGDRKPAVIHLNLDGTIQKVEVPFHGSTWESTIQKLFPTDVQKKIDEYYYSSSMHSGRAEELRIHLLYRLTHPDVPPLIILSGMPTATPAP